MKIIPQREKIKEEKDEKEDKDEKKELLRVTKMDVIYKKEEEEIKK